MTFTANMNQCPDCKMWVPLQAVHYCDPKDAAFDGIFTGGKLHTKSRIKTIELIARTLQPKLFDDEWYATQSEQRRQVNKHFRQEWLKKAEQVVEALEREGVTV